MMPGNAPCAHFDGEYCDRCLPLDYDPNNIKARLFVLEKNVTLLIDKITDIANWCYREK
jgi:hypothetical protein